MGISYYTNFGTIFIRLRVIAGVCLSRVVITLDTWYAQRKFQKSIELTRPGTLIIATPWTKSTLYLSKTEPSQQLSEPDSPLLLLLQPKVLGSEVHSIIFALYS
jgi:hypothetical protein